MRGARPTRGVAHRAALGGRVGAARPIGQAECQSVGPLKKKSTGVAYLLWFFFGPFGGHRFYLGKIGSAIGMLALFIVGVFTLFLLIPLGIWLLIDAFLIPGMIRDALETKRSEVEGKVALSATDQTPPPPLDN